MRKQLAFFCLIVLLIAAIMGCQSSSQDETTGTAAPSDTTSIASSPGVQQQYRAVCLAKEAHGGNEQVLSKWLDEREKAEALGKYHGDFKNMGHQWKIEMRVKPANAGQ